MTTGREDSREIALSPLLVDLLAQLVTQWRVLLKQSEVAAKLGIGRNSLTNWLKHGTRVKPTKLRRMSDLLQKLADEKPAGVEWELVREIKRLLSSPNGAPAVARLPEWAESFTTAWSLFEKIDHVVFDRSRSYFRTVLRMESDPMRELAERYRDTLEGELRRHGLTWDGVRDWLQDDVLVQRLATSTPAVGISAHVAPCSGASACIDITFAAEGQVVGRALRSRLLVDRADRPDVAPGPFDRMPAKPRIEKLLRESWVDIEWAGMHFLWRKDRHTWPPSIDSFLFARNFGKLGMKPRSVIDAGSGTGFLGIMSGHQLGAESIIFWEWLITPLLLSRVNLHRNRHASARLRRIDAAVAIGMRVAEVEPQLRRKADLMICNPPYMPEHDSIADLLRTETTTLGTDLLRDVIEHGDALADATLIQFSQLARPEAAQALRPDCLARSIGDEHRVPFRVYQLIDRDEYVRFLIAERGLERADGNYWHRIAMQLITRREGGRSR